MPLPFILGIAAAAVGASAIKKSKTTNEVLKEADARCKTDSQSAKVTRVETEFQQRMRKLLFEHAFYEHDKSTQPPISTDWPHLNSGMRSKATRKYTLFGWGEYSFYTSKALYYHHKKKCIHECLYYDNINSYDPDTGIIDYGTDHQKRDISRWGNFEKGFVDQISKIWNIDDETNTSVLEFCFNYCSDFKSELSYFKNINISTVFIQQFKELNTPEVLRQNYDHISIISMKDGKMELQFWQHFLMPENVEFSEDDTEFEIKMKELEQQRIFEEAAERPYEAMKVFKNLLKVKDDIAELFQKAIYTRYGVIFKKENITFLDEPSFTEQKPTALERASNAIDSLNSTAESVKAYLEDYVDKNNLRK